jgi:hypothetical protein
VKVRLAASGAAYVSLGAGEVRDSVALEALDAADTIGALGSLVLDFDHYGRLVGLRVLDSAESVLPPSLLEGAVPAGPEDAGLS